MREALGIAFWIGCGMLTIWRNGCLEEDPFQGNSYGLFDHCPSLVVLAAGPISLVWLLAKEVGLSARRHRELQYERKRVADIDARLYEQEVQRIMRDELGIVDHDLLTPKRGAKR